MLQVLGKGVTAFSHPHILSRVIFFPLTSLAEEREGDDWSHAGESTGWWPRDWG